MIQEEKSNERRHTNRTEEIVAHEAANFIKREAGDESLITVIRAMSILHGECVKVFVSVFPKEKSRAAISFLERQREAFSNHLKKYTRISPLPRVDFILENEILF